MSSHDLLIIVLFIGILVSFTPFLGKWLASVLMGRQTWLSPVLGPVERCVYRMAGVDPTREMDWKKYLTAVLLFNAAGFLVLFLSLLLAGCACPYAYGVMIGKKRQGWIIFGAMMILLVAAIVLSQWAEHAGNPLFPGMEMLEGKEVRLGVTNSSLWSVATTASSNGSVNCMHSSMSPLGGGIALFNMLLGGVIFGGLGCGLYSMLMFAMITVFLCGLMVGRTPEFLGKKMGTREVCCSMVGILLPGMAVLVMSGLAAATEAGRASICNAGPHGLTEILYCFGSQAGNNGSAFAGLAAGDTPFYSLLGGLAMLLARFGTIISVMMIAGSMASRKTAPPAQGTMGTDNLMFMVLLVAVVLVVGALTFFPALALGPILEHLLLYSGAML